MLSHSSFKPSFIVFEGIDCSGKSTQCSLLSRRLTAIGAPVYQTREPSDLRVGRLIRDILTGREKADPRVIAALFAADRLDHVLTEGDGMLWHLEHGDTVLCDRYYFSSYAYQSADASLDWVVSANSLSAGLLRPDCTIFIDITPDEALRRLSVGRDGAELFENRERLTAARDGYYAAFSRFESVERVEIVDGNRSEAQVAEDVWQIFCRVSGMSADASPLL